MTSQPESYRLIPLTQGQFAKVSPHRFEGLMQYQWSAMWNPHTKSFYAKRSVGKRSVLMHRQLLGLEYGDKRTGDHRDHDTLNNVDGNLRVATKMENNWNTRMRRSNTSGYKGVYYLSRCNFWFSLIMIDGKQMYLGNRKTAEAAYHELYIPAVRKFHGEFACFG